VGPRPRRGGRWSPGLRRLPADRRVGEDPGQVRHRGVRPAARRGAAGAAARAAADRFGIAQLHQLRGRVGRGHAQSWCYLFGEGSTPEGQTRLKALEGSNDGFELAEVDLELRGEGTILGTRQKGRSDLKLASLRRDKELVGTARQVAFAIVDADPTLADHADLADEVQLLVDDEEAEFLFKS
jgi:ATP-dependent DNA helicase RecG